MKSQTLALVRATRLVLTLGLSGVWMGAAPGALAAELTLACGGNAAEQALCSEAAQRWAGLAGHRVRVVGTPADAPARLALYQDILTVAAPELDVLEIDLDWSGRLAPQLADLDSPSAGEGMVPGLLERGRFKGRQVALPWSLDPGVLYFRRDLLERFRVPVPTTWDALEDGATRLQEAQRLLGAADFSGFLWQGRADGALVANLVEWVASQGGGNLVEADGRVSLNEPRARFALQRAADWMNGMTPQSVLAMGEAESLASFLAGRAAFLRHWGSAWPEIESTDGPARGQVGLAPLPKGDGVGRVASAARAQALAVSRFSRQPDLAMQLVRFLVGPDVQRQRLEALGLWPTLGSLYDDPEMIKARPILLSLAPLRTALAAGPATPIGAHAHAVAKLLATRVHGVLRGLEDPAAALAGLELALNGLRQQGGDW